MNKQELDWKIVEIGDKIRMLRKQAKLTQANFGKIIGISVNKLAGVELGQATLDIKQILLCCEYFGLSADELLQTEYAEQTEMSRLLGGLDEQAQKEVCDFIKFKQASKGLNTI